MEDYYIGASLLFVNRKEKMLEAVIKSYILENSTYQEFIEKVKVLGEKQNRYNRQKRKYDFEYIGIEDIFRVVGPIEEGALLGRMTIWDQTLQDANALVLQPESFAFHKQLNGFYGKWYLAIAIYYVEAKDIEDSRTISCYVLIESTNPSLVVQEALAVAGRIDFQKKIARCDLEGLNLDELQFLGFENILVVYEDVKIGGAFLKMCKEYSAMGEIRDLLVDKEELKGFFE